LTHLFKQSQKKLAKANFFVDKKKYFLYIGGGRRKGFNSLSRRWSRSSKWLKVRLRINLVWVVLVGEEGIETLNSVWMDDKLFGWVKERE
jgi:hypothetical protein